MTIQPIGSASVALYITPADLKEHGLTPAGLTLERALAITQTAFHEAGITLEGSIEIEAYPDACGVLVYLEERGVRGRRTGRAPERAWFSFDGLEPVVAAARDLPAPRPDAALLWWEDRWWLSLGAGEEQAIARLSEFGRCETARPHLEARLAEHGRPVWDQDALTALLSYFPV